MRLHRDREGEKGDREAPDLRGGICEEVNGSCGDTLSEDRALIQHTEVELSKGQMRRGQG